jgi:hypothetical protein
MQALASCGSLPLGLHEAVALRVSGGSGSLDLKSATGGVTLRGAMRDGQRAGSRS